jgi:hypothetical protein
MTNLRADQTVAREVAAAYLDGADRRDAVTVAAFAQVSQHGEHLFEAFCEFVSLHRLGCVRSVCDCSAAICRLSLASSSANKAALIWPA